MKVIDLLNKIANGEKLPNKIKYKNKIYEYREQENGYYDGLYYLHFDNFLDCLNDEIEIIEEPKKIEKFYFSVYDDERVDADYNRKIENKLNEIIDYINKGE